MLSRRTAAFIVSACATAFVLLAISVATGWTAHIDSAGRGATAWAAAHGVVPALRCVEVAFATTAVMIYVVVMATALVVRRERRLAVTVVLAMVVTSAATLVLKDLTGRPRPPWQLPDHTLLSASFPSGHASAAAALVTCMTLVALHLGHRAAGAVVSVAGAVVILLVATDRIMLGRHYPSDVLGGALLGLGVTCGAAMLLGLTRSTGSAPSSPRPMIECIGR